MSIDPSIERAGLGDVRFRDQSARIEQRHLQFGRHCRLDIGSLLSRLARQASAPDRRHDFLGATRIPASSITFL